jgi:hypothetical protein
VIIWMTQHQQQQQQRAIQQQGALAAAKAEAAKQQFARDCADLASMDDDVEVQMSRWTLQSQAQALVQAERMLQSTCEAACKAALGV